MPGKKIDMKIPSGKKKKLEEAIDTIIEFYAPITEQIRMLPPEKIIIIVEANPHLKKLVETFNLPITGG